MKYILIAICAFCQIVVNAQDYELVNLGKGVNTAYHEAAPVISADGRILYFFVHNHPENTYGKESSQDIWSSTMAGDGTWGKAIHLEKPLNNHKTNQVFTVLPDNRTLFIRGGSSKNEDGFSFTYHINDAWSRPDEIEITDFKKMHKGKFYGATISSDQKYIILYFSEKNNGTFSDLYVSKHIGRKTWGKPKKLSKNINTSRDEFAPFLAPDDKTLYFSSNRKDMGEGSSDLYKIVRLDDSWMRWSEPVNMGRPLNTSAFDAYMSVDGKGHVFTTQSGKTVDGGNLDIFSLQPKKKQPKVSGKVLDKKTNMPLKARIFITHKELDYQEKATTDAKGNYRAVLAETGWYEVLVKANGYLHAIDEIYYDGGKEPTEQVRDIHLSKIAVGATVRLNNIFFDFDKTTLKIASFRTLNHVVDFLKDNPTVHIEIAGHTDSKGSYAYNLKLSQGRAKSVVNYIISKGIDRHRLRAKGYGEKVPVASNNTEKGRATNRRVEFTVLKT